MFLLADTPPKGMMTFRVNDKEFKVYGGPYRARMSATFGVNMAAELGSLPADVYVPTRDFDIPNKSQIRRALMAAVMAGVQGRDVYVGCMGGIGRTGLFLAALAKVFGSDNPVMEVRANYIPHAVETEDQQRFIATLPVDDIKKWLKFI